MYNENDMEDENIQISNFPHQFDDSTNDTSILT